jgi:hypothetical protein
MRIELLYFDGCPSYERFLPRLRELVAEAGVDADVELRRMDSPEAAAEARFLGSPSVRVDGMDVDPGADGREDFGLKCRLYRAGVGLQGTPPDDWVLSALRAAARQTAHDPA